LTGRCTLGDIRHGKPVVVGKALEHMNPTRTLPRRALTGVAALSLSLGGAIGALVVIAAPATADTIDVTNTADDGSGTSLRGVLETASNGDVIVLTPGATYQLTICSPPR
jgi:hypothetical protein